MWLITCWKPIKVCQIHLESALAHGLFQVKGIITRIDEVVASQSTQLSELDLKLLQESSTILYI